MTLLAPLNSAGKHRQRTANQSQRMSCTDAVSAVLEAAWKGPAASLHCGGGNFGREQGNAPGHVVRNQPPGGRYSPPIFTAASTSSGVNSTVVLMSTVPLAATRRATPAAVVFSGKAR